MTTTTMPTRAQYAEAFELECAQRYPMIADLETRLGFAISRAKLQEAARVLACPVKANPPCWQHGRVLYAVARKYLAGFWINATSYGDSEKRLIKGHGEPVQLLDIGTAKGFSALVLQWARLDADVVGVVDSVDVIDPLGKDTRNSVLELDGPKRLADYLRQWPEAAGIRFYKATGHDWLKRSQDRVHVAFIDGKHTGEVVHAETRLLAGRQEPGDIVVWDDVHLADVDDAVRSMAHAYTIERVPVLPKRAYAIGVRR